MYEKGVDTVKFNADCFRDVLLELENSLAYRINEDDQLERRSVSLHELDCILIRYKKEEIFYTLTNLEQAGYINMTVQWAGNSVYRCSVTCITFQGHEFLEKIRNDQSWTKVKAGAEAIRNYSLDAINAIANGVTSAAITAYFEKNSGGKQTI